eukprot:UC4_evm4s1406
MVSHPNDCPDLLYDLEEEIIAVSSYAEDFMCSLPIQTFLDGFEEGANSGPGHSLLAAAVCQDGTYTDEGLDPLLHCSVTIDLDSPDDDQIEKAVLRFDFPKSYPRKPLRARVLCSRITKMAAKEIATELDTIASDLAIGCEPQMCRMPVKLQRIKGVGDALSAGATMYVCRIDSTI